MIDNTEFFVIDHPDYVPSGVGMVVVGINEYGEEWCIYEHLTTEEADALGQDFWGWVEFGPHLVWIPEFDDDFDLPF